MSYESRAEASEIMNAKACMMSASENKNVVGLVIGNVTGPYLMTRDVTETQVIPDPQDPRKTTTIKRTVPTLFDIDIFEQVVSDLVLRLDYVDTLLQRAVQHKLLVLPALAPGVKTPPLNFLTLQTVYGFDKLPGKLLFSMLLPSTLYYEKGDVLIIDGILVRGAIRDEHVAPYTHRSLVQVLHNIYGQETASNFITDATHLVTLYLNERGFSVGVEDCFLNEVDSNYFDIEFMQYIIDEMGIPLNKTLLQRAVDAKLITLPPLKVAKAPPLNLTTLKKNYSFDQVPDKLVFSMLLPENFSYTTSEVKVVNGILLQGEIRDEANHRSLKEELARKYGNKTADKFSADVKSFFELLKKNSLPSEDKPPSINDLIRKEILTTKAKIEALGPRLPDKLEEAARQQQILAELGNLKNFGVKIAKEALGENNSIRVMIKDVGGGGKGSSFNVAQITSILGQQLYGGKRIIESIEGQVFLEGLTGEKLPGEEFTGKRCLPHFLGGSEDIEARGYCVHSFSQGLNPTELYFHHYAGREGLIDTASNTAVSGTIHHNIVKGVENISVKHDGSVRNKIGTIFMFMYSDGFSPAELINVKNGEETVPSFIDLELESKIINSKKGWIQRRREKDVNKN